MQEFRDFMDMLLERPAMFLINSVDDIYFIVLGYTYAIPNLEQYGEIVEFFNSFNNYLRQQHDLQETTMSWHKIIRFYSSTGQNSLEEFKTQFMAYSEIHFNN